MSTATFTTTASKPSGFVADTANVLTRELRPLVREPFGILISLMQPLVFLALFAPLLPDMGPVSALQWFVPGIVAMSCLMGSSMVGASLMQEMFTGSHERLLVSPLSRSSLLVGRALREIVPTLAQTMLILAIVTPFSFDLHPLGVLVGIAVLAVFCIGIGALSFALALASKDQDWLFWTVQQTVIFPVLLLAGMLLPVENGPGWLRFLSELNPLTYVIDAERALFAGTFPASTVLAGAAAAAVVAAAGLTVGLRAMRRSS
jgi:ABC-2 type transport system permease protein